MRRFLKRHIASLVIFSLTTLAMYGWISSVRTMASYNMETPFGIFQYQSESSMFQAGAIFMKHEHRWAFWSNSDPAWGDTLRFVAESPKFIAEGGKFAVFAPYWQLILTLALLGTGALFFENRRIKRGKTEVGDKESAEAGEGVEA